MAGRRQHPEARERPPIIGKAPVMERSHHHIYPRLALRMNSGPPAAVPKNFRASSVFDYGLLGRFEPPLVRPRTVPKGALSGVPEAPLPVRGYPGLRQWSGVDTSYSVTLAIRRWHEIKRYCC